MLLPRLLERHGIVCCQLGSCSLMPLLCQREPTLVLHLRCTALVGSRLVRLTGQRIGLLDLLHELHMRLLRMLQLLLVLALQLQAALLPLLLCCGGRSRMRLARSSDSSSMCLLCCSACGCMLRLHLQGACKLAA